MDEYIDIRSQMLPNQEVIVDQINQKGKRAEPVNKTAVEMESAKQIKCAKSKEPLERVIPHVPAQPAAGKEKRA